MWHTCFNWNETKVCIVFCEDLHKINTNPWGHTTYNLSASCFWGGPIHSTGQGKQGENHKKHLSWDTNQTSPLIWSKPINLKYKKRIKKKERFAINKFPLFLFNFWNGGLLKVYILPLRIMRLFLCCSSMSLWLPSFFF